MEQLNISWCEFGSDHVKAVVANLPSSLTDLNLSGYREQLAQEGAMVFILIGNNIQISFTLIASLYLLNAHFIITLMYILMFCGISDLELLVERCPNIITLDIR
jgi:hypothetical protein